MTRAKAIESRTISGKEVSRMQGVVGALERKEYRLRTRLTEVQAELTRAVIARHKAEMALLDAERLYEQESGDDER